MSDKTDPIAVDSDLAIANTSPGFYLSEESHHRLVRLKDHMHFLSRLAQPRTVAEERDRAPAVRMDELAFCLELLADQIDLVLDDLSWPAFLQPPRR